MFDATHSSDRATGRYISMLRAIPPLSRDEELALARAYRHHNDRAAGERIVAANLRNVVPFALRYRKLGIPLGELIAQGALGLFEALRRFDPSRELRFATYANHWVRAEIRTFVLRCRSIVGGGVGPLRPKYAVRMRRERACLQGQLGDEAEVRRVLAQRFGKSEHEIAGILSRLDQGDASLDGRSGEESSRSLGEGLAAVDPDPDAQLDRKHAQQACAQILAESIEELDAREHFLLERRLMADEDAELSLQAIGTHFGVSRERARQIEVRVKAKLRERLSPVAQQFEQAAVSR